MILKSFYIKLHTTRFVYYLEELSHDFWKENQAKETVLLSFFKSNFLALRLPQPLPSGSFITELFL